MGFHTIRFRSIQTIYFRTIASMLLIGLLIVGSGVCPAWAQESEEISETAPIDSYEKLKTFSEILSLLEANYVEKVDTNELIDGAIRGMLKTLDPHTSYLPPEAFKQMKVETSGRFGGLGIEITVYNQVAIILAVSTLGVLSAVSGVQKGIRRLSEFNIWLSLLLLIVIVLLGPTWYLLSSIPVNLVDYVVNVIPMGFWISDSVEGVAWQGAWSIFYWGWWLAWTPFVALFVARISRGRTVREFTLGVLLVPSLITVIWMSVFGGTALHQELVEPGVVSSVVANNYALGLVETIHGLQVPSLETPILMLVALLLLTWLITSLDSATLVVCHILRMDHIPGMKVFWGFILGGVTCTLLLIGGITALQAASIIIGLPMAILVLLTLLSVVKMIFQFRLPAASQEILN